MHTMTARERVSLAINHTETDRAATGEITIADEVVEGFFQINGVTFTERAEFANRLGIDALVRELGRVDLFFANDEEARLITGEHLARLQVTGVAMAVLAIVLITK